MSALPSEKCSSSVEAQAGSQESQKTQGYSSPQDTQNVWGTLLPNGDAMDQKVYELTGRFIPTDCIIIYAK